MQTILMQGDSITDCGRTEKHLNLGDGYVTMVAGEMTLDYPGKFRVLNRGISGNRIVDLYARIRRDFINLEPDYLSILIGVNDVWHSFTDAPNGVDNEAFRRVYCMMIEEILSVRPSVKIYILEPFMLRGSENDPDFEAKRREVYRRAASAKYVAERYGLTFIPLQKKLDQLCEVCDPVYWLSDGVHPTPAGHAFIAHALLDALKKDIG